MSNADKISREVSDLIYLYALIFGAIFVVAGAQLTIFLLFSDPGISICVGLPLLIAGLIIVSAMLRDKIYHRFIFRPAYPPYGVPPAVPASPDMPEVPTAIPVEDGAAEKEENEENEERWKTEESENEPPPPADDDIPYAVPADPTPPPPPPPQYPGYYPPYYSPTPRPAAPYYSIPYITYIQYFRETLSIPHIRTLLIIFIISIAGGSAVLIAGFPWIMLFPIFFIVAFTFPSFIWISYVYHKDVLEPESRHAIFLALTWGMFSTIFAVIPNTIADVLYGGVVAAVLVAPFNEEFFKPLGIRRVKGEINSELDGLIYGVTCGMGFAIIENFMYELTFLFSGDSYIVVWSLGSFIRGLGGTIIHAVGAGLIGFTYARGKLEMKRRRENPALTPHPLLNLYNLPLIGAYLVAVSIHMSWNFSASIPEMWDSIPAVILSIGGHILVFILAFYIIKSLANEGIRRDIERHNNTPYLNPIDSEK